MKRTEQLRNLFHEWKQLPMDGEFHHDGIICEDEYDLNPSGHKLLFIAKEPNAKNHEHTHAKNFVTEWSNIKKPPGYLFAKIIALWSYGILNDFPIYSEAVEKIETLRRIAFMNLKKTGGNGLTPRGIIAKIVREQKEKILNEINIIDPDIIILCSGFEEEARRLFAEESNWVNSGYEIKLAKWNDKKIIEFYHPSSRNAAAASYSLLENVINSEAFKNL